MKLMPPSNRIAALNGLDPACEEALVREMCLRTFAKGDYLFHQGDDARAVYLIERGRVSWERVSIEGQALALQVAGRGEAVGLVALLDRSPYVAGAVAVTDTVAWELSVAGFDRLIMKRSALAMQFMRLLGGSVRSLVEHVHAMNGRSAHERVIQVLLHRAGHPVGSGTVIPLTHQEIAQFGGMARETVSRVLSDLRRRGAVHLTRSAVIVVDPALLRECERRASTG